MHILTILAISRGKSQSQSQERCKEAEDKEQGKEGSMHMTTNNKWHYITCSSAERIKLWKQLPQTIQHTNNVTLTYIRQMVAFTLNERDRQYMSASIRNLRNQLLLQYVIAIILSLYSCYFHVCNQYQYHDIVYDIQYPQFTFEIVQMHTCNNVDELASNCILNWRW